MAWIACSCIISRHSFKFLQTIESIVTVNYGWQLLDATTAVVLPIAIGRTGGAEEVRWGRGGRERLLIVVVLLVMIRED